jgi:endonuclease YncB( thermonuclease family)
MSVRHLLKYLLIWLLLSSSFHLANGKEFNLQGEVERVMDGDTVQLITANSTKVKIRLLGIDAPESDQSFGPESKQHLIGLSGSQRVTAQSIGVDRYKRSLCKIVANGIDLNLEQLKSGMAWHYKAYASSQSKKDQEVYASAETQAQHARVGLWASNLTIPHWEYRKGPKADKQTHDSIETTGVVKMSRSKICHQPGGRYYSKTTKFTAFASMAECLAAGGRAPKN